jgi:MOSC domain-containing protein YiiM
VSALVDPIVDIEDAIRALRPATDRARIELVVVRPQRNERATPRRIRLDVETGVVGDHWKQGKANPEAQVTLMRWDVARLFGPDPAIFGDNLFAAIDTSERNLPPGTIVQVGAARCVVTPKLHTGCSKFSARTSADILALTRADAWKPFHLRGIHLRVLESGDVAVGDELVVLSRP